MNLAQNSNSGVLRWAVRFGLYLILFAGLALLVSYGFQRLGNPEKPAAVQPTPVPSASVTPALPTGAAGHTP